MRIPEETLRKFVVKVANTRPEEAGCDTCFEHLHEFADMLQKGEDPADLMPLVEHHLKMCSSCGEEFDALIEAIEAAQNAKS
ncbi:MAG: hypothetical protein OEV06_11480 [Anaerolineae bacterium]|nr:hypothetical protein [Anaerolineae bacterium]